MGFKKNFQECCDISILHFLFVLIFFLFVINIVINPEIQQLFFLFFLFFIILAIFCNYKYYKNFYGNIVNEKNFQHKSKFYLYFFAGIGIFIFSNLFHYFKIYFPDYNYDYFYFLQSLSFTFIIVSCIQHTQTYFFFNKFEKIFSFFIITLLFISGVILIDMYFTFSTEFRKSNYILFFNLLSILFFELNYQTLEETLLSKSEREISPLLHEELNPKLSRSKTIRFILDSSILKFKIFLSIFVFIFALLGYFLISHYQNDFFEKFCISLLSTSIFVISIFIFTILFIRKPLIFLISLNDMEKNNISSFYTMFISISVICSIGMVWYISFFFRKNEIGFDIFQICLYCHLVKHINLNF